MRRHAEESCLARRQHFQQTGFFFLTIFRSDVLLFLSNSKFSFSFAADLKSIPEHHQRRRCLFVARSWTNGFAALCEGARLISPSLIMAKKKLSESRRVSPNVNLRGQLEESAGAAKLSDIGQLRQSSNKNVVLINANQTGGNAKKIN